MVNDRTMTWMPNLIAIIALIVLVAGFVRVDFVLMLIASALFANASWMYAHRRHARR